MSCEAFDAMLSDYLEGTLDIPNRASVEQHLRECLRCAALVRDIDGIRKDAAALPDLVPARDLWAGIDSRIQAPVIPFASRAVRQRRFAAWMGVAAAALVISTAGVTYLLTARSLTPTQRVVASSGSPDANAAQSTDVNQGAGATQTAATGSANGARIGSPSGAISQTARVSGVDERGGATKATLASRNIGSPNTHSETVYGKEIEMLQKIVSERKGQLDPVTVAVIERNLTIIDRAIAQSRAALAKDPASMLLSQQLTHSLDKKVELLRTAALLPAST
ncbi:MAG: zf-HC2 domain-containing protein [Gemmatimonadaceae bacterium]